MGFQEDKEAERDGLRKAEGGVGQAHSVATVLEPTWGLTSAHDFLVPAS